jgi:hypothetical protein
MVNGAKGLELPIQRFMSWFDSEYMIGYIIIDFHFYVTCRNALHSAFFFM